MSISQAFARRLKALDIELPQTNVDQDDSAFQRLMIRLQSEIDANSFDLSKQFDVDLPLFLKSINCPYLLSDRKATIEWCIAYALRNRYACKFLQSNDAVMSEDVQQVSMPDRLNELTWDENSLTQGVQRLAQTLQLLPHPKPVVTLKAILLRLQQIESSDSLESTKAASDFDLLQLPLGFNTDDPALQNAARILRLLLVADLRQLQNEINQLLVATQQQTAQPKTDTSLGQVGR